MTYFLASWSATGRVPGKSGSCTLMIAPYQAFPTADGELVIAAGNNALFARLSQAFGQPEWAEDPRFADNGRRVENRAALAALIEAEMRSAPTAALAARLDAAGVPNAPVHTVDQVASHPQTAASGMLRGGGAHTGALRFFGLPLAFDGQRPAREAPAPALGADDGWLARLLADEPER